MSDGEATLLGLVRERLDREDDLLAHRTTWAVTSQAFLFSAYAISVAAANRAPAGRWAHRLDVLVNLIPCTAIIALGLLLVTIWGALRAMTRLRGLVLPDSPAYREILHGDRLCRLAGRTGPLLIPTVFLFTWIALLLLS